MRALQKLVRNGNSTHVAIPRTVLVWLGWLPGEPIILEVAENKTIILRRPAPDEFTPKRSMSVVLDGAMPGSK